jgi:hypothetical protein
MEKLKRRHHMGYLGIEGDNIKNYSGDTGCEDVDCIELADMICRQSFVTG